ncbi:deoxyribonuclease IV [Anaerolineales bacterium HSG25]|nr:deoxyribonuclease IV [Anaerolineales bacterium HSG25]
MLIGAHLSIAGGVDKAFKRATDIDCTAMQIFTKSNRQWKAKELKPDEIERYHQHLEETKLPVVCHASYLINLGSPKEEIRQKSINALVIELQRCETLKIPYLVLHPGAHMKAGVDAGVAEVIKSLNTVHAQLPDYQVKIALEITAGQGSALGAKFEEIGAMIKGCDDSDRLVVCFDTCHALAAGYEFRTPESYEAMLTEFDQTIGLDRLKVFHVNDSQKDLGSHVDRHTHIGEGYIGLEPFGYFLNDLRFKDIPFLLETPKKKDPEDDIRNLAALRRLIK